jgi:hypothetical protein
MVEDPIDHDRSIDHPIDHDRSIGSIDHLINMIDRSFDQLW